MTQPTGAPRRGIRVLVKQGHLLKRLKTKLVQMYLWTYTGIMMLTIRNPEKSAVFYGKNDDEENLLALALALTRTYQGDIVYLAGDIKRTEAYLQTLAPSVSGSKPTIIKVRARTNKSILQLHVRCQIVLTSHILISSPTARGKRIHIHVSHGLGPKTYRNIRSSETALVSNTSVWNDQHLRSMGKDPRTKILPGYPRQDALKPDLNSHEASIEKLGIDANVPFVVWAPTVRSANFGARGRWTEGAELQADEDGGTWRLLPKLLAAASDFGITLIAKPHPIEASAMRDLGLHVITNDDIWNAGMSPYEFIGASSGLISDYSSIWIDYFATNHPVGLYCPDLEVFQSGIRGLLDPPFDRLASGLFINSPTDAREFFTCVKAGRPYNAQDYRRVRSDIGYYETKHERSGILVDEIRSLGALKEASLAFDSNGA
jgi:CDP-glycerol glycerophosphotransferase